MSRLHLVIALLWMVHGVGWGEIRYTLDTPQDDRKVRQSVQERAELKPEATELNDLIETRLWPLTTEEIDKFFGPKLAGHPQDMVLPIFCPDGVMISGLSPYPDHTGGKRRIELHAVGDVGYVELYYDWFGNLGTGVFYLRADSAFVPLQSDADFSKRLAWDTAQFERVRGWLDKHLPKVTDFGEVAVADHTPTHIRLANGKDYLVTAMVDADSNYSVQLMVDSTNKDEQNKSVLYREIERPGEPVGFAVDGRFYRLTPKLKSPPAKMNLGVVALSKTGPTRLDVGADRECIATIRKGPSYDAIYLDVRCKSYSQGITEPIPTPGDSITFAIDGNIVSFTPVLR